ncbi:MAG TPA: hypothetical protein VFO10_30690 [Oligoflexus sp.]|uniref:hypothetical protein n=1 Tax=Oligoflexus sp. TaxID=1971216 RepID=UPI002D805134|nr:hypothetical protein [Oligoflexus sp.]HET9241675.1 hypothetical protein [Oligoflexus sp.]
MKFVGLAIFIVVIAAIGFWGKREARNVSGSPPKPQVIETESRVPTPVGTPSGLPSPPAAARPPTTDDLTPRLEKIHELARYTLPTQETREALIQSLSDPELHSALGHALAASDGAAYDASAEKLRMNAVSVLGLIFRYKDVSHRDEVIRSVKQRILAVDFHKMKDLRVKQSVYGDITELLMILKQHDPESYEDVSRRITETKNKVLKTALAASR